jgi:hypothetical protein
MLRPTKAAKNRSALQIFFAHHGDTWAKLGRQSISSTGLPDAIVSNQKSQLGTENVGIFYVDLEYIKSIWYILQPFGMLHGDLVYYILGHLVI